MVPIKTVFGEQKAWSIIETLDPDEVRRRASVAYDPSSGLYLVRSFGMNFYVSASEKKIFSDSPDSSLLLDRLKDFFRLSLLWYLVSARDIPETGRLIKPIHVRGGHRFFAGTHVLPLDQVADKYAADKEAFIEKGRRFGAQLLPYGDAALRLSPLPRVPAIVILWLEDEEFPARADLVFDSTCDRHVPSSDIIWSIAVMSVLILL